MWSSSLERHKQTFGDVPELYGSDRGFFSERNVTSCKQQGVKVVCIPQRGGTKTPEREAYEKSREFKDGQRFRAGIEGRISVLFRGRGMKRCLAEGRERFELWVAAAVLANNLMKIAALLAEPIIAQTKSRLTISLAHSFVAERYPPEPSCNRPRRPTGAVRNRDENRRPEYLANADIRRQFTPVLLAEMARLTQNAGVSRQKLARDRRSDQC